MPAPPLRSLSLANPTQRLPDLGWSSVTTALKPAFSDGAGKNQPVGTLPSSPSSKSKLTGPAGGSARRHDTPHIGWTAKASQRKVRARIIFMEKPSCSSGMGARSLRFSLRWRRIANGNAREALVLGEMSIRAGDEVSEGCKE